MKRATGLSVLGVLLLLMPASTEADGVTPGTWKLTTLAATGMAETTNWLFKLETKDGATTATLAATSPAPAGAKKGGKQAQPKLVSFALTGDDVRLVVKSGAADFTFEGRVSKDGKKIVGVYGNDAGILPAYMAPTSWTEIAAKDATVTIAPEELKQVAELEAKVEQLRTKALQTKDQDEKEKVLKQAFEATKTAEAQVPGLLRKVAATAPPTFTSRRVALQLLQNVKISADNAELQTWASKAAGDADEFGQSWKAEVNQQVAKALLDRQQAPMAVPFAEAAEKSLPVSASEAMQEKILTTVSSALKAAGKLAEANAAKDRLELVLKKLDDQYSAKVPPFKGKAYAGRDNKSRRVAVMELFTGSECPDCICSDVAFDVLHETYKPSELVLLAYHVHIPRPDPMTNADTEARQKYYKATGTPTVFFNGKIKSTVGGGGPMTLAEKKYEEFCKTIDKLLQEPATLEISASARHNNGKVQIEASVKGLENPGDSKKLRIALVEDKIRFPGGNRLRFHQQVVRALVGGQAGFSVTTPNFSKTGMVDLPTLRKDLNLYLDDYAANKRAFPREARPLDFNGLHVVAFVQDDATKEILQAVQVDVQE
jgi:hypothetical protein